MRIQAVAELSGVPAATLRAWERRYGVPRPERTAAAYRLYAEGDVALVRRMKALCDRGVSAAEAARTVLAEAAEAAEAAAVPAGSEPGERPLAPEGGDGDGGDATLPGGAPFTRLAGRLLDGALRWDATAIDTELLRLAATLDAQSLYDDVFAPVLAEVGRRWARGHLSVGQEHLLSERIELLLRALLRASDRREVPSWWRPA